MDVHEGTATVREAMRFSAYLRQPSSVPKEEKDAYVEEMIELLELTDLADALVFSLSVESRKRLTIGVELASKPELLLFLDEPTSGLDAQRSVYFPWYLLSVVMTPGSQRLESCSFPSQTRRPGTSHPLHHPSAFVAAL